MEYIKKGAQCFFDGTPFKILYLLLTLLAYTSITAQTKGLTIFSLAVTAIGGVVLIYRVVCLKHFIRTPNLLFLGLFFVSFLISAVVNWKYGIMGNLKGAVWMAFQYGLLFACDDTKEPGFYKREFHILSLIYLAYMAICAAVSLYFLCTGRGGAIEHGDTRIFYGLWWQRLWGAFSEPNYAAVAMVTAILLAFYFFKICKQIWLKIGCWVLIALYASYVLFSDSRTGKVCLAVGVAVLTYLLLINPTKRDRKKALTHVVAIVLALVVAAGSYFGVYYVKKGYNYIRENIQTSQTENPGDSLNLVIGREQDLENDVSNGRFSLWKSGVDIFCTSPVFGVGARNLTAAADDKAPDTYLVNNPNGGKFDSTHNMLLDVFAAQGAVGFVLIVLAMALIIVSVIRLLSRNLKENYTAVATMVAVVICIGASGMFLPNVIYVNTQSTFLFWLFLGYLMYYYSKTRDKARHTRVSTQEQQEEQEVSRPEIHENI